MALHNINYGPQSRAPLKWGEVAKKLTASRHHGCLTNMPYKREDKGLKSSEEKRKRATLELNVGTWNVRTMRVRGKLENVKQEMRRLKLNVLGLSEVRWEGEGDFVSDEYRVIYSGSKGGQKGVAVIVDSDVGRRITKVVQHSDRLLLVRIKAEPVDVGLV